MSSSEFSNGPGDIEPQNSDEQKKLEEQLQETKALLQRTTRDFEKLSKSYEERIEELQERINDYEVRLNKANEKLKRMEIVEANNERLKEESQRRALEILKLKKNQQNPDNSSPDS